MTQQQIRQTYNQLYATEDNKKKRRVLEQLRTEAEQLGLKDWVQLIEARLASVNGQHDAALKLSTAFLGRPKLSSELRATGLINRGAVYVLSDPPRIEEAIADYTTVIKMPDAPAEEKAVAMRGRGAAYRKSDPTRVEEAIADYTAVIKMPDAPPEQKALALFYRGVAYDDSEPPRTEDAIADYTAVIEMPDALAEHKASALFSRGTRYVKLDPPRTEDAIADYTAVIEMPDAPAEHKAWALYNRAVRYVRLEPPRTEDAIADYAAVIQMPDAPAKQKAWALVNRGFTYGTSKPPRTEDEIADYTAVIEMADAPPDQKAKALVNRGLAYKEKGEPNKTRDDLLEAKKAYKQIGNKDSLESVDFMLSRLGVSNEDLSQEDQEIIKAVSSTSATDEQLGIEDKIIKEFTAKKTSVYQEYNKRRPSSYSQGADEENEAILAILKGWGSAVPLLLGGEGACRGGGYFLKFNGKGLAVDPGHDFLRNFHGQEFHLRELDAVLVSHNHPDHTHDLKSIDDVKYEMRASSKKKPKPYWLVLDNDTDRRTEEWTRDPKDFRKPPIRIDANRQHDTVNLNEEADLPFNIQSFKAEHTKDVPNAVGYRVSCLKDKKAVLTIGFSCDTKYFSDLCNEDNLGGCDILVAHMSQPTIPELKDPDNAEFKENHLGYRGTIELIKGCKPKLTIVSEFWAGLDDARILLLQGLRKRCKTSNILPGGVGLLVKVTCEPMSFQILCTNCKEWTQHEKIKVGSPSTSFGPLNYLCPDCCL